MAELERDGEGVEAIGGRENAAGLGTRKRPARSSRQVLLLDRGANRLGVTREARVLGADVALEVRELADELRRLVSLGEPCRLESRVASAETRDEVDEPSRLVRERAAAFEERDRGEAAGEGVDADVQVPLEREGGVVEPVLEHALVPLKDDVGRTAVWDDCETIRPEREVALVLLHRRLDDSARQLEEPLLKSPLENDRPFDQVHDLVQNACRIAPSFRERVDDLLPSRRRVGLDLDAAQLLRVLLRRRDRHRAAREPVSEGMVSADRLVVELRQDPAHRPRVAQPAVVPAHGLREPQPSYDLVDLLREDVAQSLAGKLDAEKTVPDLELIDRDAVPAREPGRCALAHLLGRPFDPRRLGLVR